MRARRRLLVILTLAIGALATVLGGIAQRTTGIGFALVATPLLVLVLGPLDSIVIVNLCAALSASLVTVQVWRAIEWRRYLPLAIGGLIGIPFGVLTAIAVDRAILQCIVGAVMISALVTPLVFRDLKVGVESRAVSLGSGVVAGYLNAVAGVGGPALTAYALVSRWDYERFRATVQPIFVTIGFGSLVAKLVLGGETYEAPGLLLFAVMAVFTVVGITVGGVVARHLPIRVARVLVIVIASAGAGVILVQGVVLLITRSG